MDMMHLAHIAALDYCAELLDPEGQLHHAPILGLSESVRNGSEARGHGRLTLLLHGLGSHRRGPRSPGQNVPTQFSDLPLPPCVLVTEETVV